MKQQSRGFTLLELLLVVGIAAILIVAGITTYNLVTRGNQVNEAVRLVNTLADQTRRLYSSQSSYGTASTNIEAALYNAGSVPSRYIGGAAGVITSPFSSTATAVAVTGDATAGQFNVSMAMPPNLVAEVVSTFNPAQSSEIVSVTYCGTSTSANVDPAAVSTACGSSTTIPTTANFNVEFR